MLNFLRGGGGGGGGGRRGEGAKVLSKLTVPGRPTKLDYSRAKRRYWVNLQCWGVLLNWIIVV